ncbi:hypothetical protein ACQWFR_24725, partial [Salmonella enterica subsp. enterica serovar Infantis]
RVNAIQNVGALFVLFTDKTVTLTLDIIFFEHNLDFRVVKSGRVFMLAWLNSSSQIGARIVLYRAILLFVVGRIAPSKKGRLIKLV